MKDSHQGGELKLRASAEQVWLTLITRLSQLDPLYPPGKGSQIGIYREWFPTLFHIVIEAKNSIASRITCPTIIRQRRHAHEDYQ